MNYGSSQMLSEVLFNNGVACFAVPLVLNVITLAFTLVNTQIARSAHNCLIVFRDALTPILISRFLLDLGAFGAHQNNGTNSLSEGAGTDMMRFVSELSGSHAESTGSVMRETTSGDEYELGCISTESLSHARRGLRWSIRSSWR
ncbi:hypothetical protein C8Q74DRAFT_339066 [Fomes fomentarius]|nr:hypothetical protein C8Q74DRAFT_339066 [Fomes fomentarius]